MPNAACLALCFIGGASLIGMVSASPDHPAESGSVVLRIPGTTVPFEMVRCPEGTVHHADGSSTKVESLYVLKTEVTWDLYDIYVYELDEPDGSSPADGVSRPSKPYVPPDRGFGHDGYPAIGMTIDAAEGFCRWLSLKTGLEFRLPARQEWTYLAAGESLAAYCCDVEADSLDRVAWFVDNSKFSTHAVGEKRPNLFGLYDIHGNASEWVTSDSRKPIALGGSFRDDADECTSTSFQQQLRSWNTSDPQIPKSSWWLADCSWVGFRFVIEADTIDQSILQELTDE